MELHDRSINRAVSPKLRDQLHQEKCLGTIDELQAAMTSGWAEDGTADPDAALRAAMARARSHIDYPGPEVVLGRAKPRCDAAVPRAGAHCIRAVGHPGRTGRDEIYRRFLGPGGRQRRRRRHHRVLPVGGQLDLRSNGFATSGPAQHPGRNLWTADANDSGTKQDM